MLLTSIIHEWIILKKHTRGILLCALTFLLSPSIINAQKFQVLNQFESLCKCGILEIHDSTIQSEIKKNNDFFLGNSKNAMLTLNYFIYKNDDQNIEIYLNKLCEQGVVIDNTFKQKCKNLAKLNQSVNCNQKFDSVEIDRIVKMFDTEQNIRTFYKPNFGFTNIRDIMIKIDSFNMHLIDSFYIKTNNFPQEINISALIFYKLFLVIFHNVDQQNNIRWIELNAFLYALLEKGTLNSNYYSMLVDRYQEKNGFPSLYGAGLTNIVSRIGEVNLNRIKIGLRELSLGCD